MTIIKKHSLKHLNEGRGAKQLDTISTQRKRCFRLHPGAGRGIKMPAQKGGRRTGDGKMEFFDAAAKLKTESQQQRKGDGPGKNWGHLSNECFQLEKLPKHSSRKKFKKVENGPKQRGSVSWEPVEKTIIRGGEDLVCLLICTNQGGGAGTKGEREEIHHGNGDFTSTD